MKIVHRYTFTASKLERSRLLDAGVARIVDAGTICYFEMAEEDPRWPRLSQVALALGAGDRISTVFTAAEVRSAAWCQLLPTWHAGYPQPEDMGYLAETYDLRNFCQQCGIGLRQVAPFRLQSTPRWGKRSITQLHYVFDEFFVREGAYQDAFRSCAARLPVLGRTGAPLEDVVQLVIREEVRIATDGLAPYTCVRCGRTKFEPHVRGRFPALAATPRNDLVRTAASFGSGASAHAEVLASRVLVNRLLDGRVGGVAFRPLDDPGRAGASNPSKPTGGGPDG